MELPRGREKKFNKRNTWFGICYLILQEDIDEATAAVLKLLIFAEFLLESHFICKFSKALPTKLMYSKPYDPNALNTTRYHRLPENVTFGKYQTWRVVDTRPDYALFLCFICCPVVRLASSHLNTIYFLFPLTFIISGHLSRDGGYCYSLSYCLQQGQLIIQERNADFEGEWVSWVLFSRFALSAAQHQK